MWVGERTAGKVKALRDAGGLRRKLGVGVGGTQRGGVLKERQTGRSHVTDRWTDR